jgi:uncharacterized protein YhbP (UPF0306 family)
VGEDTLAQVRAFLTRERTLSLSTLGARGAPQAANLYYVETDDLSLFFISVPGSRHAGNIARDPRVAVTIYADSTTWCDIRGLQLEGTCFPVTGVQRAGAWALYTAKFPFVLADAALARALSKVGVYRITPHWLRWIDNSLGLGHNREWLLADGEWQMLVAPDR